MKLAMLVFCFLFPLAAAGQQPSSVPEIIDPPRKFDEWSGLPFSDEKARLDNLAIQWQQSPSNLIHIVIYAGRRTCAGEAQVHWNRVRDWLVHERSVPIEKISWIDGGYREKQTLICWLWPAEFRKPEPPYKSLERSEVKFFKKCAAQKK
jgi:hypothetical protein